MDREPLENEQTLEFHDYLNIILHRVRWLVVPAILIFVISAVIAILLPPVYRSTATILVESQQIPTQLVQSMVTSFADERIQVIKQRVMTRENLLKIIEKFSLYANQQISLTGMVQQLRRSVFVEMINTKQRSRGATIAFTVAFENRDVAIAQKVTNELVTLFLNENAEARTKRAIETTEFLAQEAKKISRQMQDIEQQIAQYKEEFADSLPENLGLNTGSLERARADLRELDRDVKATEEQKRFFEVELSTLRSSPAEAGGQRGNTVLSLAEQLIALQNQLTIKEVEFTPSHPDIQNLNLQIASIKAKLETSGTRDEVESALDVAKTELRRLRGQFTDKHPDVKQQQQHVEALNTRLRVLPTEPPPAIAKLPGYREIEARIQAMDGRLATFAEQRVVLAAKVDDLERRIEKTPQVERGFKTLARDYENSSAKYREVRNKEMEAQLAQNLEEDRKAERFLLLEPADHPERPEKPNRIGIMFLGLILGIGVGGSAVFIAELLDKSVRGAAQLNVILKEAVLMSVPYIVTAEDEMRSKRRKRILLFVSVLILALGALAIHFFYRPLDELAFVVMRRFGLR